MFYGRLSDFIAVINEATATHIYEMPPFAAHLSRSLAPQFLILKDCDLHGKTNHTKLRVAVRRALQAYLSGSSLFKMDARTQLDTASKVANLIQVLIKAE